MREKIQDIKQQYENAKPAINMVVELVRNGTIENLDTAGKMIDERGGYEKYGNFWIITDVDLYMHVVHDLDKFTKNDPDSNKTDKGLAEDFFRLNDPDNPKPTSGIVATSGKQYLRLINVVRPYFHQTESLSETQLRARVDRFKKQIQTDADGATIDVYKKLSRVILGDLLQELFGYQTTNPKELDQIADDTRLFFGHNAEKGFTDPTRFKNIADVLFSLTGKTRQHKKAAERLEQFVSRVINNGERQGENATQLMKDFLKAPNNYQTSKGKEGLTKREMEYQILEFISAGHMTTVNTLGWILAEMGNPDQKRIEEAEIFFRGLGAEPITSMVDGKNPHWQTILKIGADHTPTIMGFRGVKEDVTVQHHHGDVEFLEGDNIIFLMRQIIQNAREKYPEDADLLLFGDGPRICAGRFLARAQIMSYLRAFAETGIRYLFETRPDDRIKDALGRPMGKGMETVKVTMMTIF